MVCTTAKGSFCEIVRPMRPSAEEIAAMTDARVAEAAGPLNEKGRSRAAGRADGRQDRGDHCRYYAIIVAVVSFVLAIIAAIYSITKPLMDDVSELKADVRELRSESAATAARHEESRISNRARASSAWGMTVRRVEARQNADAQH